ncbi:MAG TPA: ABC-three component system protein [Bryobacteraceae bacterium]|nr:ABC-three component system protein [Bryobacteraceae bacterium]
MTEKQTMPATVPLATPANVPNLSADQVQNGMLHPAIELIKLFSSTQWEEFIQEWAHSLKPQYSDVVRCGGAGDKGRDVIGYVGAASSGVWDNYQCKHYDHPLQPGDVWLEIAKACYYTSIGEYVWPQQYFFVAPRGVGTTLHSLLKNPARLKERLVAAWNSDLAAKITATGSVPLEGALQLHVSGLDFSVFKALSILSVIEQHRRTGWFAARFGGGLPPMPPDLIPPAEIAPQETRYVRQLLNAYGDHLATSLGDVGDLVPHQNLRSHFDRARQEFYIAETLRNFSRDTLQPGEYENLQNQFHAGVVDTVAGQHADGYARVIETIKTARALQITSHPLVPRVKVEARGGICHQLANEDKIQWVP